MNKTQQLYEEAKRRIPGGTQLLTKRPEMTLPDLWPAYYSRAKGCRVWDLDGNEYIDTSYMGIGSCILGYADDDVDNAVKEAINNGSMCTLNCPEEVELAQKLCALHPWASKVRYARTGGEAMAVAVRIARAKTGRDAIMFCGYHGWHDWYLSTNLSNEGNLTVPAGLAGTAIPFQYNDIDAFESSFNKCKNKLAAVIMEPLRNYCPATGFLERIRELTTENKIPLIFDEITSGWRIVPHGVHIILGVNPDIAVFAKAISNGYPMAAIIGRSDVMDAAQNTFISSTYWTERIGPVAALATIEKLIANDICHALAIIGRRVEKIWADMAKKHGMEIKLTGMPQLSHFDFVKYNGGWQDVVGEEKLIMKTLFSQYMLQQGFLATNAFYASYGHTMDDIDEYEKAVDVSFCEIRNAMSSGDPENYLEGPICHSGFERLN